MRRALPQSAPGLARRRDRAAAHAGGAQHATQRLRGDRQADCGTGGLELHGSQVRLVGHDATDNPRDVLLWQRARVEMLAADVHIRSVRELAQALRASPEQLGDVLHRRSALGDVVKLTSRRFALAHTMETLARKAQEAADGSTDGFFTAAQYRDVIGTGRTLAIEILECLDRQGLTRRRGDLRSIASAPQPRERHDGPPS